MDFVFPGHTGTVRGWAGYVVNVFDPRDSIACLVIKPKESVVCLVTRDVHRPSAGPPIMSAKQVADRFNIFDHDDLERFARFIQGWHSSRRIARWTTVMEFLRGPQVARRQLALL